MRPHRKQQRTDIRVASDDERAISVDLCGQVDTVDHCGRAQIDPYVRGTLGVLAQLAMLKRICHGPVSCIQVALGARSARWLLLAASVGSADGLEACE
jgi:hypothetical protein